MLNAMNITNTSSIYNSDKILYHDFKFLLCFFAVIIFIIIPCITTTDEYKDITPICRPLYCWLSSFYYLMRKINNSIVNTYNKINAIEKKCNCCNKTEIPEAINIDNISQSSMPDTIIIIYNNSIIVNAPIDESHASVINKSPVAIGEEIFTPT